MLCCAGAKRTQKKCQIPPNWSHKCLCSHSVLKLYNELNSLAKEASTPNH